MPTPNTRPRLEATSRLAPAPRHYPLPDRIRRHGEDTEERRRPYQNDAWLPDGGNSIATASGANIVAAVLANAGFAESLKKFYADGPGKVRYEGRILTGLVATVIASVEEDAIPGGGYVLSPDLSRQLERLLARVEVQVFRGQSSTPTLEGITLADLIHGVLLDPHLHQFACDKEFRVTLVHPDVVPRLTPDAATRTWVEILLTATFEDFDPEAPEAVMDDEDAEMEDASVPPEAYYTPDTAPYTADPPTFDGETKPWAPSVQLPPGLGAGLAAKPDLTRPGLLNVPGKASVSTPASQLQVAPGKEGVFTLNKQDNQVIYTGNTKK